MVDNDHNHIDVSNFSADGKEKIKKAIIELDNSMTRIDGERDYQKETINNLAEELGVDKKMIRRMARTYHKGNYSEQIIDNEAFESSYQLIFG